MTTVGVVLPFYQREKGLLRSALISVLNQKRQQGTRLLVVVVDDESPVPPEPEIDGLAFGCSKEHNIVLLKQRNGGPGSARNLGLDYLDSQDVDFIAFLDTDDEWHLNHLQAAISCLGQDYDYYFSNHNRHSFEDGATYFQRSSKISEWLRLQDGSPFEATAEPHIFTLTKARQFSAFMEDYLSQTSTVVYRHATLGHVRFDTSLRTAGEDLLFWLTLGRLARRVVLNTEASVSCGSGVNIFHATLDWNHPDTPSRFAYQLMLWTYVRQRFDLTDADANTVATKIRGFERGFSFMWLRALIRRGKANEHLLRTLNLRIGWNLWRAVPALAAAFTRRLRREQMFPEH